MERIQFITHQGKRILYLDFSSCKAEEVNELMEKAKPVFKAEPLNSILVLDNTTNTHFTPETTKLLGEFMEHNKPYVKAAAVFGASGLLKIVLGGAQRASNRTLNVCETETEAKDWLAGLD